MTRGCSASSSAGPKRNTPGVPQSHGCCVDPAPWCEQRPRAGARPPQQAPPWAPRLVRRRLHTDPHPCAHGVCDGAQATFGSSASPPRADAPSQRVWGSHGHLSHSPCVYIFSSSILFQKRFCSRDPTRTPSAPWRRSLKSTVSAAQRPAGPPGAKRGSTPGPQPRSVPGPGPLRPSPPLHPQACGTGPAFSEHSMSCWRPPSRQSRAMGSRSGLSDVSAPGPPPAGVGPASPSLVSSSGQRVPAHP